MRQPISASQPDSGQKYVISVEFWGPNCRRFSCEKFIVERSEERRCIRGLAEANMMCDFFSPPTITEASLPWTHRI